MRIVAGRFRGRPLRGPGRVAMRPTSDRLRETLFNVLAPHVSGARVLDAYAGTGAIGLEALSRGAAHATFLERDRGALAVLDANIRTLDVAGSCRVLRGDARTHLGGTAAPPDLYDLIVLDPPYDDPALPEALERAASWLAPGGRLVLEHARRREVPAEAGALRRFRLLEAGDSALSFYAVPAS